MKNHNQKRGKFSFQVQFSTKGDQVCIEGNLCDLSINGCRISGEFALPPVGAIIELCIFPGNDAIPLLIDRAIVQWAEQKEIGVTFYEIRPDVRNRIKEICHKVTL